MSKNIYVGNLNFDVNETQLADLFAQYGDVESARIIIDRYTDRSKGFAFVEMAQVEGAQAAISELNGKEWMSRQLRVNEAQDKGRRNY